MGVIALLTTSNKIIIPHRKMGRGRERGRGQTEKDIYKFIKRIIYIEKERE